MLSPSYPLVLILIRWNGERFVDSDFKTQRKIANMCNLSVDQILSDLLQFKSEFSLQLHLGGSC